MNYKILSLILICALLSNIGAATTANKDLPTQSQVLSFIETVPIGDNFTKIASEMAVAEHPSWKWDIWATNSTKLISFYYTDPASKKGYGSTYLSDMGFVQNKLCYVNMTLVTGYNGTEEVQVVENVTEPVEEVISDEIAPDIIIPKNNTTQEIENTTASDPSEINVFMKNATSGDEVNIKSSLTEPTEQKKKSFLSMLSNAWNMIFGGE